MQESSYVVVQCPFGCGCRLRFPRADRNLQVTCPRCKQTFTWTPFGIVWDDRFHAAKRRRLSLLVHHAGGKLKWIGVALLLMLALAGLSVLTENPTQEVSSSKPQSLNENVPSPKPDRRKQSLPDGGDRNLPVPKSPVVSDNHADRLSDRAEGILPPANLIPPPNRRKQRLPNGTYLEPRRFTQGHSSLLVENGTGWDAVVKLVKHEGESKITARCVYIRHGESVLLTNIEPGNYKLAWCHGEDWNNVSMQFEQPRGCFVAERTFTFTESLTTNLDGTYIRSTKGRVTLHAVFGGNLGRNGISQEEFQGL